MVMSWIISTMILISVICALIAGNGTALAAATATDGSTKFIRTALVLGA